LKIGQRLSESQIIAAIFREAGNNDALNNGYIACSKLPHIFKTFENIHLSGVISKLIQQGSIK